MENGADEQPEVELNGSENEQDVDNQTDSIDLQQQLDEMKDKYIRMIAEFDNYKKRSIREKLDFMKSAAQDTLSALLPVLDDFDRAKKFAEGKEGANWDPGVDLVYQKLYTIVRNKGLEPMDSTGQAFDADMHEAITEIPAPSEEMKGKVVDTIEKGYRLNDKIIRHAKVVVGK
ncbi:MAG: nucleotide exchange factor GrpE [Saprospiraceae bacterium]|nr:nucleotide exchange factor GrpE [Saprospiraceae bacterium]MCF8252821.1 nucleotide exchange factor GrpE [Saprospiraceae bacterium]MCF8314376.1 nucleotide exchange factor GrpE [Saprospiraceae bacterium]MCF8443255.1 nucleotide exchange factor GrpE [Saprospiraceae bacterium]